MPASRPHGFYYFVKQELTKLQEGITVPSMITLTITLSNGEAHSFDVPKMPRHWNSWLMHQLPYGTDFQGCTFSRTIKEEK